nr:hypothetical protein CFP56_09800 [Quercus suber]
MGLISLKDGHFQGWLAAFLCCCAVVDEDEDHVEGQYCQSSEQGRALRKQDKLCNEQPVPSARLGSVPGLRHWSVGQNHKTNIDPVDHTAQSDKLLLEPLSLKPLQLGSSSLLPRPFPHQRCNSASGPHQGRPSIGAPTAFRRLEHTEGQRASLIPLRLGPVVLNDIVPPPVSQPWRPPSYISADIADHVLKRADSTIDTSSEASIEESDHTIYWTPQEQTQTDEQPRESWSQLPQERVAFTGSDQFKDHPSRPMVSTRSSSSSLRRQAIETSAASAFARLNGTPMSRERPAMKRKMSLPSLRRSQMGNGEIDLDQEILELNTIVEEKRVEGARSTTPNEHRPAIAPTMQVRARSETLSDIGSAFSRPHTSRDAIPSSTFPAQPISKTLRRTSSQPLSRSISRSSSRVSGWLSGILHSSFASTPPPPPEPFYKCIPRGTQHLRATSERSLCSSSSSLTELDSPALTLASSPTSKGHSRSITAESTIQIPAPVYHTHTSFPLTNKTQTPQTFPEIMHQPSQVGLAL